MAALLTNDAPFLEGNNPKHDDLDTTAWQPQYPG